MPDTTETLTLERDYAATPVELFAAWTDVELLAQWFGCATEMFWTIHAWDARPGGAIHVSLDAGGKPFVVKGAFVVVDPPHHLQYRWGDGELVDVTIEARGEGSRLRLRHTFAAGARMREILTGGWTASLSHLEHVRHPQSEPAR